MPDPRIRIFQLDRLRIRLVPVSGGWEAELGNFRREWSPSAIIPSETISLRLHPLAPEEDPRPLSPGQDLPIEVQRRGKGIEFLSSGCRAEYDLENREGSLRILPGRLADSLENFLRVVYSYFLVRQGGFLLHAFGFSWENSRAFILFGPSGSGKSTAAGFLSEVSRDGLNHGTVLSDDVIQVVPAGEGGFLASRPPLETRFPPFPGRFRVRGAYRLRKSRRNRISLLRPAAALSHLLANVLYVSEDPETVPGLAEVLAGFVRFCPVAELHFRPGPDLFKLILADHSEK